MHGVREMRSESTDTMVVRWWIGILIYLICFEVFLYGKVLPDRAKVLFVGHPSVPYCPLLESLYSDIHAFFFFFSVFTIKKRIHINLVRRELRKSEKKLFLNESGMEPKQAWSTSLKFRTTKVTIQLAAGFTLQYTYGINSEAALHNKRKMPYNKG